MKKKILILTLNDYVIYQPTILNLYDFLSPHFDVTVISFQPKFATKKKDEKRNIVYLETNFLSSQFYQKLDFILSRFSRVIKSFFPEYQYYHQYYNRYLPYILKSFLKKGKPQSDIIIAVDLQALFIAQQLYGSVHFLSLEIDNNTNKYYKKINKSKIKSVFVQSQIRYDYLFPETKLKTFIVQNAPVFEGKSVEQKDRKDCIWAGAIDRRLAVLDCLEFFNHYPNYKLEMKGGGDKKTRKIIEERYNHLIKQEVVIFNQEYLPDNSFIDFLSKFEVGFCFYSWELIQSSFNYLTAPSGKLFMYFAAGTPVIACNIPGFFFVKEFGAGVLIDDYKPETIFKALKHIESNYEQYSDACYAIAKQYSFDKHVKPYIDFLIEQG